MNNYILYIVKLLLIISGRTDVMFRVTTNHSLWNIKTKHVTQTQCCYYISW